MFSLPVTASTFKKSFPSGNGTDDGAKTLKLGRSSFSLDFGGGFSVAEENVRKLLQAETVST